MSNELRRPCPFCGSNEVVVKDVEMTFIECHKCGAVVSFRGNEKLADAIVMFNGTEGDAEQKLAFQKGMNRWQKIMEN